MLNTGDVKRLCAHWSLLFDFDGPACMKIRPIVSSQHPLRRLNIRNRLLNEEIKEIGRLLSGPDPFIPHRIKRLDTIIASRPGFAAVIMATRLLNRGIHETTLQRYDRQLARLFSRSDGKWTFEKSDMSLGDHFNNARNSFEPRPANLLEFTCIFGTDVDPEFPLHRMPDLNIRYNQLKKLDDRVANHLLEIASKFPDVGSWLDLKWYISVRVRAVDPSSAVDNAISVFEKLRDEFSLWGGNQPDPYRDLHRQVAIITPVEVVTFDWRRLRRSFKGLYTSAKYTEILAAIEGGGDLERLIACHSRAQQMFNTASDGDILQVLFRAQDILFREYYTLTYAWAVKTRGANPSDFFVDVAARWMAMNAPREIFESAVIEGTAADQRALKRLRNLPPSEMLRVYAGSIGDDGEWPDGTIRFGRATTIARLEYLARIAGSEKRWHSGFRKHYIRFALDLNEVRTMRNSLAHDNMFVGRGYYVTMLMNLLREIIVFRLNMFSGYLSLEDRYKKIIDDLCSRWNKRPEPVMFALSMHGVMLDSQWTLCRTPAVWLNENRIARMHWNGWGNWGTGKIAGMICEKSADLARLTSYNWTPLEHVKDLHLVEII